MTIYVTHSLNWLLVLDGNSPLVYFPAKTTCPECGGKLLVSVTEWESETGIPTYCGVEFECDNEGFEENGERWHQWHQSDWQPVRDVLARWAKRHLRRIG